MASSLAMSESAPAKAQALPKTPSRALAETLADPEFHRLVKEPTIADIKKEDLENCTHAIEMMDKMEAKIRQTDKVILKYGKLKTSLKSKKDKAKADSIIERKLIRVKMFQRLKYSWRHWAGKECADIWNKEIVGLW